jgi:ABC-type multidrug transport system fused ATPase/permease subunit
VMRFELCLRVMRFPTPQFRRTSAGELIPMIIAELEPVGDFIGDAVALPAFQGGTLITMVAFMFAQDWALGLAAISLYPRPRTTKLPGPTPAVAASRSNPCPTSTKTASLGSMH